MMALLLNIRPQSFEHLDLPSMRALLPNNSKGGPYDGAVAEFSVAEL